jgi:hypothetical protein
VRSRIAVLLLLLPQSLFGDDSGKIQFRTLPQSVIQQRLEGVPHTLTDRKAALITLFHEAGCEVTEQPVAHSKAGNLICTMPGEGQSTIVVGGHFDFIDRGTGAVDDWSGSVLLPSLYESLKTIPRQHRYIFIAFASEENGMHGSQTYVKNLSREEKGTIHAMINLECLGTTPPKAWASRADKRLLSFYAWAAQSLQLEARGSNVDNIGDDDSHPFLDAKIPVLTIHSITSETLPLLHSRRDTVQAIHPDDYFSAYQLTLRLLAVLDSKVE